MIDLLAKNSEMLRDGKYNVRDTMQLSKIAGLKNPNDYDLYQIVCALCNYDLPEKAELRDIRMQLFLKVSNSGIDYSHKPSDYGKVESGIRCTNTKEINKFGHFVFKINTRDKNLIHTLWEYKSKECLKYVDDKAEPDAIIVSVARDQFENFKTLLEQLNISYDKKNLEANVYYSNRSKHKLIDVDELDLPFKPFDFQIEDAEKIIKTKRQLIGHEMGCVSGKGRLRVQINGLYRAITIHTLYKTIQQEDKDVKIAALVDGEIKFVPVVEIVDKGVQNTIRITTSSSSIECTQDHLIFTDYGWKPAMDIVTGDVLITSSDCWGGKERTFKYKTKQEYETVLTDVCTTEYVDRLVAEDKPFKTRGEEVINIQQGEKQPVYDIIIDGGEIHNFICDNFIVHNCGKTLISILVGESIHIPKLVVCPEALRINWYREIKRAKNDADVQILYSHENFHMGEDWTIVGYKTVLKFLKRLKKIKCLFVDECHCCKSVDNYGNPTSDRAKALLELSQSVEYCYLLSGTPVPSKNKDLFNILKMLRCEAYNLDSMWSFKNFADRYCDPKDNGFGKNYNGNSNSQELHSVLSAKMVRRKKKDVLPDLAKQRQFIPIEPTFKRDYKEIEYLLYHPRRDSKGRVLDTYMALAMTGRQLLSQYKCETAIGIADTIISGEESVVIVTQFVETADKLKAHFKSNACEIRGGMNDKEKQLAMDDFQAGRKKVCILNITAGGVGITLTAAHTMIVIDYVWNPSDMIQVEDRICRTGQTESCMIYYLYCSNSTFDRVFVDLITAKSANTDLVVDNSENTFDLNEYLRNSSENDLYGLRDALLSKKSKGKG